MNLTRGSPSLPGGGGPERQMSVQPWPALTSASNTPHRASLNDHPATPCSARSARRKDIIQPRMLDRHASRGTLRIAGESAALGWPSSPTITSGKGQMLVSDEARQHWNGDPKSVRYSLVVPVKPH